MTQKKRAIWEWERDKSVERVAKSEQQRWDAGGFANTKQGQAARRRYLPQLEKIIRADHSRSQRDKKLWHQLRDVKDLALRLLYIGITVCAADELGVDRDTGEK